MPELITQGAFAAGLKVALGIALVSCLVAGIAYGKRTGDIRRGALLGGLCSALAPLIYCLWLVYSRRIGYDPETGVAGLHRVSVFLTNLALFVAVGAAVGVIAALVARRRHSDDG